MTNYDDNDEELDDYVEICDHKDHQWEAIKLSSQSQSQIEFMQGWSNCAKPLWKYGIAVSYKIEVDTYNHKSLYKSSDKILICLDDYNDTICKKLTTINQKGRFELVEWIDQYERKDWYPIANNLEQEDIDIIINHTVEINSKFSHLACIICNFPLTHQLWVCMDKDWCYNNFHTVMVCNGHIGDDKLIAKTYSAKDNHRMMLYVFERNRKGWMPKNIYRNCPHEIEKKVYARNELINNLNQNNIGGGNDADKKTTSNMYDANDTQELFRRVSKQSLNNLSIGFQE